MAPASAKATADKTKAASKKASAAKKRKEAPAGAAATLRQARLLAAASSEDVVGEGRDAQDHGRPARPVGKRGGSAPACVTGKAGSKKAIKKAAPTAVAEKKESTPSAPKRAPKIRICLSAFDHVVLDEAAAKIIDTAERSGAVVHGPIPLPTHIRKFTVLRATFKFKDARDQFEMRTHRRLIDLTETTHKTVDALQNLSLPSGVDIEIKMMT